MKGWAIPAAAPRVPRSLGAWRSLVAGLVGIGVGATSFPVRAAAATFPVIACPTPEYVGLLRDAEDALATMPPATARARASLMALIESPPSPRAAQPVRVLGPIIADLAGSPPAVDDARRRLQALTGVLGLTIGADCTDDGSAARASLRRVYASPVFAHLDSGPAGGGFTQWLGDALISVVTGVVRGLGGSASMTFAAVLLVAILGFAVWRVRGAMASGRRVPMPSDPERPGDDPDVEWAAGLAAAASGDLREAVRRVFRSALLGAAVGGRLHLNSAWTTRELLERAGDDADLVAALAPAAATFDRAWYSPHAVDEATWVAARDRCAAIRKLPPRLRAPR